MEPTAPQREDFQRILDSITKKIPRFVGLANSFQRKQIPIDNISDFVLGLIYQNFSEKSVEYNVEYVKAHADTTKEEHVLDLASIIIDVFQTDAKSIKESIQTELSKN